MSYRPAYALLLGALLGGIAGATGNHHGLTAQTNTGTGTGTGTAAAPPDQPKITEAQWNEKFSQLPPDVERPSYAAYASLAPDKRAEFERRFDSFDTNFNTRRLDHGDFTRQVGDRVASLNSLLSAQPMRRVADGDTATGTVEPAVPQTGPDTSVTTNSRTNTQTSTGSSTAESAEPAKKDTTPDVPTPTGEKTVVNAETRSLLKNGALGALAGAVVGIGLLPLFGPIGIFIGAAMGAALMIGTKMLAG
ncbi:MAG: hypothetical protein HY553_12375 [Elusimicrobia bacterium]|nr:hypothetical protein [Elusimicrobiota bacterium]